MYIIWEGEYVYMGIRIYVYMGEYIWGGIQWGRWKTRNMEKSCTDHYSDIAKPLPNRPWLCHDLWITW